MVAIARRREKQESTWKLGAHHYIDSVAQNVAAELTRLGGAQVVLATVTNAKAKSATIGGLGVNGKLLIVGAASDAVEAMPFDLIGARRSIQGWPSGAAIDSEDTLAFSAQTGVEPIIETMPLERAAEAYDRMLTGKSRFRMVLTTGR